MPDIYNRAGTQYGGSFAADGAKIIFSSGGFVGAGPGGQGLGTVGPGGAGLLTQNLQINYQQQVTRFYEIGTNYTFMIAGRTQGQLSLGRVLGPRKISTQFYKTYGDVCNMAQNNINLELISGCNENLGSIAFKVLNLVLVSIGVSIAAQDMIINEQVAAMFISLEAQDQ